MHISFDPEHPSQTGHTHAEHAHTAHAFEEDFATSFDGGPDFWEPQAPAPSELNDHEVPLKGKWLTGKHVALLVSGGIAAYTSPSLARELRKYGAKVTVFASEEALRYVTLDALAWSSNQPVISSLSARAEHLGDGQHFDAYLLAPATYNTLNKFRYGIADSLLTTLLASALGRLEQGQSRILVAPTMHGSMHNRLLEESLLKLQEWGVDVIPPRDAYGKHNLPSAEECVFRVARSLSSSSLRQQPILVTSGPTPVAIDNIRLLTNRFTGALGLEIAKALFVAGAEVHWVQGPSPLQLPDWLPVYRISSFDEYQQTVLHLIGEHQCRAGIFSAAVADYRPLAVASGKLPSGGQVSEIPLTPTAKIIQEVQAQYPALSLISFKFEAGVSHEQLLQIAQQRLQTGSSAVVANRDEEQSGEQIAWLVTESGVQKMAGKPEIAATLVNWLENHFDTQAEATL